MEGVIADVAGIALFAGVVGGDLRLLVLLRAH
jgi:hypothetical protein